MADGKAYIKDPDPEGTAREARRAAREQAHQAATEDTRITRDDLKGMSPDAIVAAKKAGELDHLLKGDDHG